VCVGGGEQMLEALQKEVSPPCRGVSAHARAHRLEGGREGGRLGGSREDICTAQDKSESAGAGSSAAGQGHHSPVWAPLSQCGRVGAWSQCGLVTRDKRPLSQSTALSNVGSLVFTCLNVAVWGSVALSRE
jgi:hypothetical protein